MMLTRFLFGDKDQREEVREQVVGVPIEHNETVIHEHNATIEFNSVQEIHDHSRNDQD